VLCVSNQLQLVQFGSYTLIVKVHEMYMGIVKVSQERVCKLRSRVQLRENFINKSKPVFSDAFYITTGISIISPAD